MQQSMFGAKEWTLSVTQLNEYVRKSLAADPMLKKLRLRGEISNFKRHTSGHLYFSLKDEQARISCVMFRQHAMGLNLRPQEGMRVVLSGQVSLFARDGQYQFYAEQMRPDGMGELYLRFETLKEKLSAEGLFDPARKRMLPLLPRRIGVVTSPTGAAVRDIIRVAKARNPGVDLLIYPARVQGEDAADEVIEGIRVLSRIECVDVIIIGRGGGSLEDLWAFNEERLARAVGDSPVPIISAVGHETDTTISDFVADVRAATPSAAAMLAVLEVAALRLTLDELARRMAGQMQNRTQSAEEKLARLRALVAGHAPQVQMRMWAQRLSHLAERMTLSLSYRMLTLDRELQQRRQQLRALGPGEVLRRGYTLLRQDDQVVPSARAALAGPAQLVFWDGQAEIHIGNTVIKERKDGGEEKNDSNF